MLRAAAVEARIRASSPAFMHFTKELGAPPCASSCSAAWPWRLEEERHPLAIGARRH